MFTFFFNETCMMRKFSCQSWGDFMNFLLSVSFLRQVNNSEPSYWGRADTGRPRPRLVQDIFVYLGSGKIKEEAQREGVWRGGKRGVGRHQLTRAER